MNDPRNFLTVHEFETLSFTVTGLTLLAVHRSSSLALERKLVSLTTLPLTTVIHFHALLISTMNEIAWKEPFLKSAVLAV